MSGVDHPIHYNQGQYECIDVMQDVFGTAATQHFCKLNAFKYIWREGAKNGRQDVEKAKWYLTKWLELDAYWDDDQEEEDHESDDADGDFFHDTLSSFFDTVKKGFKEGLEMYAESIDPESEASKRLRYFQYSKRQGYDEDVCFITALRTKMDVIEKRLKDEEEKNEQQDQKSGEK